MINKLYFLLHTFKSNVYNFSCLNVLSKIGIHVPFRPASVSALLITTLKGSPVLLFGGTVFSMYFTRVSVFKFLFLGVSIVSNTNEISLNLFVFTAPLGCRSVRPASHANE